MMRFLGGQIRTSQMCKILGTSRKIWIGRLIKNSVWVITVIEKILEDREKRPEYRGYRNK